VGEFISNNIALIALVLASAAMLVWPEISRLVGVSGAEIGTLEATRLMNQGPTLILDVRDDKDFAAGHLPKARHIPVRELAKRMEEIAKFKAKPVIVTDKGGARAGAACRFLKKEGFTNVFLLRGGLAAWQQASLPVEK
jgi:rhodanese-related sulfurtransferase